MNRGFSLLELVLGCSLLLLTTMVTFSIFRYGFQGFRLASGRNDLQSDARATISRLKQDLEQSTFTGISMDIGLTRRSTVPLLAGASVQPRHLLSMPALSDWNAPANFNTDTGLPTWDSYILYQAGLETVKARLFRVELTAAGFSGQAWSDFSAYSGNYLSSPAPKGTNINGVAVRGMRALAGNLLGFEVSKSSKDIIVTLRLWNRAQGPLEGSRQRDEILELRSRFAPKNQAF